MKGIILAGGKGSRLYPITKVISKQLLPIYDKPLIYYPMSVLMIAGIRDILIITTPEDASIFNKLLGDGSNYGIKLSYIAQDEPRGIADAFILGEEFIQDESVCIILGDNIFYGNSLTQQLKEAVKLQDGAIIFGYPVKDPRSFGVVEIDEDFNVLTIEEKPEIPKSNYAIPGLYFYDNNVIEIAKKIKPSLRDELEITTINKEYLKHGKLIVKLLGEGIVWLDTGTSNGLLHASNFVETIQSSQGLYVACIEEIAYRMNYISLQDLKNMGNSMDKTEYGQYILQIE